MTKALSTASPRPRQLLTRILEEPELVGLIQGLEAPVLSQLIQHIGLEDSGELVALATTEQLERIFDEDLWRSARPGKDETFDAERFALWLQVMLEAGVEFTAQKLSELDEDLVTLAVCKHVLVVDMDALSGRMSTNSRSDEDDLTDKALESCLSEEFAEYQLIAKDPMSWDALLSVLVELDKNHHDFLTRLLDRCCYLSTEYIEDNGGLYNVLTSEEMLESDVAAEREQRREQEGYVAPSSAVSFLNLARVTPLDELASARIEDPITRSYFRAFGSARGPGREDAKPLPQVSSEKAVRFLQTLREAQVLPEQTPHPLLAAGQTPAPETDLSIKSAIRALRDRDGVAYGDRLQELSYLANVLLSGCALGGRGFRPLEAADGALAVCNLGLERLLEESPAADAEGLLLAPQSLVRLFRVGWNLLHHEVLCFCARRLLEVLTHRVDGLRDGQESKDLRRMVATLKADLHAGKPWLSRGRLDSLGGTLERGEIQALKALLSEYPFLPRALAGGPKKEDRVSRFITTAKHLHAIQEFMKRLGGEAR